MAKIFFLTILFWGNLAMTAEIESPFRIEMQLIPGKGHTSFADAVERVDIRLINVSQRPQLVQRSDTLPVDEAFELSTTGRLWSKDENELVPIDVRGVKKRTVPRPTEESFQIVEPNKSIYLTSFVIRQPGGKNSPLLAVMGGQKFENLKPGKFDFEFTWAMGTHHFEYSTELAKKMKIGPAWKGLLRSEKFPFEITKNPDGTFDCEG